MTSNYELVLLVLHRSPRVRSCGGAVLLSTPRPSAVTGRSTQLGSRRAFLKRVLQRGPGACGGVCVQACVCVLGAGGGTHLCMLASTSFPIFPKGGSGPGRVVPQALDSALAKMGGEGTMLHVGESSEFLLAQLAGEAQLFRATRSGTGTCSPLRGSRETCYLDESPLDPRKRPPVVATAAAGRKPRRRKDSGGGEAGGASPTRFAPPPLTLQPIVACFEL